MSKVVIELYTGRCNFGYSCAGGLANIIRYWDIPDGTDVPIPKVIEGSQGFRSTTNVRLDIMSAIYVIKSVIDNTNSGKISKPGQVNAYGVSEYFYKVVSHKWLNKWQENGWMSTGYKGSPPRPIENRDLWEQFIETQKELRGIGACLKLLNDVHDVKSYADWIFKANDLALEAAKSTDLIADEKWEVLCKNIENRR